MMENKQNHYGTAAMAAGETYEAKVGMEMLERCGNNPNGKGVVHELLYRDAYNANPLNIASGRNAQLARSATAVRDDIVIRQGGKIVRRAQLKDTANSVGKTVQQAAGHKYAGTALMGTEETTAAYTAKTAKVGSDLQKMQSTGISSGTTSRIANKALGKALPLDSVLSAAGTAAGFGGAIGDAISELFSWF